MIRIKNLCKAFDGRNVLNNLTLSIERGSVVGILGPNASGKSTLIKCILGLVNPDSGVLHLDGEKISRQSHYRSKIGYMPQASRFPDNLTVGELFAMLEDLRGGSADLDIELFARYDLGAIKRQRLGTLSGGTRQKINAAVAFLFSPRVFILDEPTVGLDPLSTLILKDKIRKESAAGKTVVLSSHLVNEVEELATHILYIVDGRPIFDGSVAEINAVTAETRLERALVKMMENNHGKPHS